MSISACQRVSISAKSHLTPSPSPLRSQAHFGEGSNAAGLRRFVFWRMWLEAGIAFCDYIRLLNKKTLWIRLELSISASQHLSLSAKAKAI
jgi:hypothetical protein